MKFKFGLLMFYRMHAMVKKLKSERKLMLKKSKTLEFKKEMSDTFLKTVSAFASFDICKIDYFGE